MKEILPSQETVEIFENLGYRDPLVRSDLARAVSIIEENSCTKGSLVEDNGSSEYVLSFPRSGSSSSDKINRIFLRSLEGTRPSFVIDTVEATDTLPRIDAVFFQIDREGCWAIRFCWQATDNKVHYIDIVAAEENGPVFSRRGISRGDLFMVPNDSLPGSFYIF